MRISNYRVTVFFKNPVDLIKGTDFAGIVKEEDVLQSTVLNIKTKKALTEEEINSLVKQIFGSREVTKVSTQTKFDIS